MENKDYSDENLILVEALNDYLSSISEIREQVKNEEGPENRYTYRALLFSVDKQIPIGT